MNTRNSLFIFLILITCYLFFAADLKNEYYDKENGYKILYPLSWTINSQPHSKNMIKADIISADKKTGVQVRIYQKNQPFEQFVTWYVSQFRKEMSDPILLSLQYQRYAERKGCSITFDGRSRNGYFLKNYLVQDSTRIFIFQCGTPFNQKE